MDSTPTDQRESSSARNTELVWAVVPAPWADEENLVVLARSTFEHWSKRIPVLACSSWGDLRRAITPEVYAEVCGLCGYGSFEDFTTHLDITGSAPLPHLRTAAADVYDADAVPPGDDEPFSAYDDIGACADGDWPPAIPYLMNQELPSEILDRYAERTETNFNGTFATLLASDKAAVLHDLETLGYRVVEDPELRALIPD